MANLVQSSGAATSCYNCGTDIDTSKRDETYEKIDKLTLSPQWDFFKRIESENANSAISMHKKLTECKEALECPTHHKMDCISDPKTSEHIKAIDEMLHHLMSIITSKSSSEREAI